MYLSRKIEKFNEKDIFQVWEIFLGVLIVFWYSFFWYRHFSACNFISEGRPSYPLSTARSEFRGCQGRRTGVAMTTVSNSLILGMWVTKVLENGDKN